MREFKTESKKLLEMMINSVYTNREIFLRELIANASDAVDKLYFKGLTDPDISLGKDELAIAVAFDKEARTITISDTGIGMDADELEENLGVIAHSGSFEFRNEVAPQEEKPAVGEDDEEGAETPEEEYEPKQEGVDIIGQFGVGFYSAFMVAKKVKVVSAPFGSDKAYVWESDGVEGYEISEGQREGHGTDVILTLRDDTDKEDYSEFLSE